jgi:hypothetical protein
MDDDRLEKLERQVHLLENYTVQGFWQTLDAIYEKSLPSRIIKCIICDHCDHRPGFEITSDTCQFGGGHLERYRCPTCDTIFGPMKYLDLPEAFVNTDYALLYSRYSEADLTEVEVPAFHSLNPKKGGRYLNWGCGAWSKSVDALRADGWDVWGFEPSAGPAAQPFVLTSRDQLAENYDGVFSNNVIEHFRDPVSQFHEFRKLLTPEGVMAHSSPCYVYCYPFTRFHVYFPLGKSPEVLADKTGFQVIGTSSVGQYINKSFIKKLS